MSRVRVTGDDFDFDGIGDEAEASALASIAALKCPVHGESPKRVGETDDWVFCCETLAAMAEEADI